MLRFPSTSKSARPVATVAPSPPAAPPSPRRDMAQGRGSAPARRNRGWRGRTPQANVGGQKRLAETSSEINFEMPQRKVSRTGREGTLARIAGLEGHLGHGVLCGVIIMCVIACCLLSCLPRRVVKHCMCCCYVWSCHCVYVIACGLL